MSVHRCANCGHRTTKVFVGRGYLLYCSGDCRKDNERKHPTKEEVLWELDDYFREKGVLNRQEERLHERLRTAMYG